MSRRKVSGLHVDGDDLPADQRMVELDLGLDPEAARIRAELAEGVAHRDPHRLEHADVAARLVERFEADLIDRRDERRGAAVHDRHFRTVDLDHRVVDAEAAQRRQDVLGGGHQRARRIAQDGGEFGGGDRSGCRRGSRGRGGRRRRVRMKRMPVSASAGCRVSVTGKPGMNPDTGQRGLIAKRGLPADLHTPSHRLACRRRGGDADHTGDVEPLSCHR